MRTLASSYKLKQGMAWFPLVNNESPETAELNIKRDKLQEMARKITPNCDLLLGILKYNLSKDTIDVDLKIYT